MGNSEKQENATLRNKFAQISAEVTAEIQIHCAPDAKIGDPGRDSEHKEQLRTTALKRLVLGMFATNGFNVSRVCQKAGIEYTKIILERQSSVGRLRNNK